MLVKRKQAAAFLLCFAVMVVTAARPDIETNLSKRSRDIKSRTEPSALGEDTMADTENEVFLRVASPMQDKNATSGDTVFFKCKVDGWPKKDMQFTWYREDVVIKPSSEPRITISSRPWGSRLRLKDLFTSDSGLYRCEASNGIRRVHTTALLSVSFELPPPPSENEKPIINFPRGKCETYSSAVCRDYLGGAQIYVDAFENKKKMERQLRTALRQISDTSYVSRKCQRYAVPAFCHFVFTPCRVDENGDSKRGERLCKEDCEMLKSDICYKEYLQRNDNPFLKEVFNSANCSLLPSFKNSDCVRIGLTSQTTEEVCYRGVGDEYRGEVNVAGSGAACMKWPKRMRLKYPELLGGHNFCRNPGSKQEKPWCFVDQERTVKETCNVNECDPQDTETLSHPDKESIYLVRAIVLSCATAVIVLLSTLFVFCVCCRGNKRCCFSSSTEKNSQASVPLLSIKATVPQLKSNAVYLFSQLGVGEYGKVYTGRIANDKLFPDNLTVAVKTLEKKPSTSQLQSFKHEMEILSNIDHPRVTKMQAAILDTNFRALVFEYAYQETLEKYLTKNNPLVKSPSNFEAQSSLKNKDLINMAMQIASGMEYLTTHNFIHRDLAARNVLVCGNMDLKICNLGVVRDSYLSSYYRSPQGGQMLPVRWMAPESLQSWQFSGKSSVWSFGVLLWEMFSYGLQPYCGYSNHEVLDMISRRQLLTCPDQCPAKIYSLMLECWAADPQSRPNFKELQIKLQSSLLEECPFVVESFSYNCNLESLNIPTSSPPKYSIFPEGHAMPSEGGLSVEITRKNEEMA